MQLVREAETGYAWVDWVVVCKVLLAADVEAVALACFDEELHVIYIRAWERKLHMNLIPEVGILFRILKENNLFQVKLLVIWMIFIEFHHTIDCEVEFNVVYNQLRWLLFAFLAVWV